MKARLWAGVELMLVVAFFWFAYWFKPTHSTAWLIYFATAGFIFYPLISNLLRRHTRTHPILDKKQFWPALSLCLKLGLPVLCLLGWMAWDKPLLAPDHNFTIAVGPWLVSLYDKYLYVWIYLPLAFGQQYLFMAFVWDRLRILFGHELQAAIWSWVLFVTMHVPNPVLLIAGAVGGSLFWFIFFRHRNILPIVLLHALCGILLYKATSTFLPNMMVGRYYFMK